MARYRLKLAAALAVSLVAVGLGLSAEGGGPRATRGIRADSGAPVEFSLVLKLPGQQRLTRFLSALDDPRSPSYHHFIDAKSFGERFGLSSQRLGVLAGGLARAGVRVLAAYPQRTALDVSAPAAVVERLFGVSVLRRASPATAGSLLFMGRPKVPQRMASAVSAVAGLSGPVRQLPDDVRSGGLAPVDASAAYDIAPLYKQGDAGQGETVAIVSFAGYSQSDLDHFDRHFGLAPLAPQNVSVDGGATDNSSAQASEVELDMEIVHEVAPQATIVNYNAPSTDASGNDTFGAIIDRIVADGRARIVTDSWGSCELATAGGDLQRDEQAIEAAVAHGVSIFKAAGDAGAYQCQRSDPSDHRLSTEWPTSSPGVIAVGGTSLAVAVNGSYVRETSWQDPLEQSGGGGGLSAIFARPPWQQAPGVQNSFSNGKRQLPDVSADADVATGWATYTGGSPGETGGTSAASPFWAASMALVDEYARKHGVSHLGFVDPMLYALASKPQPAPPFHDVTVGTNRYYPATPGWDFATGLGSPDVFNLAQDVVAFLKHP